MLINRQRKVKLNLKYLEDAFGLLEKKIPQSLKKIYITLVSDKTIISVNKKFLNKNYPTDVISFKLGFFGDVIISAETAKRQSFEVNHSVEKEILYLAIHGILHLLGFNDDEHNYDKMKEKQDSIFTEIAGVLDAKR